MYRLLLCFYGHIIAILEGVPLVICSVPLLIDISVVVSDFGLTNSAGVRTLDVCEYI